MYYRYSALQDMQSISSFAIGMIIVVFMVGMARLFNKVLLPEYRSLEEEFAGRKPPLLEPEGWPTIEEDIAIGRASGYPECCIRYYIESRLNPDLPRWLHPKKDYIVCPKHARELGAKPTYTWREAWGKTLPEHHSNIVWAEIDPNIRWVVREFRRRGYNTISSCEGHLEDGSPTYIAFKADKDTWDKIDQMGKKYFEPERLTPEVPGATRYTRWFEGHPADLVLYNDMTIHIELWPPMPPLWKEEVMSKESWIETANRFWHWIFEVLPAI